MCFRLHPVHYFISCPCTDLFYLFFSARRAAFLPLPVLVPQRFTHHGCLTPTFIHRPGIGEIFPPPFTTTCCQNSEASIYCTYTSDIPLTLDIGVQCTRSLVDPSVLSTTVTCVAICVRATRAWAHCEDQRIALHPQCWQFDV